MSGKVGLVVSRKMFAKYRTGSLQNLCFFVFTLRACVWVCVRCLLYGKMLGGSIGLQSEFVFQLRLCGGGLGVEKRSWRGFYVVGRILRVTPPLFAQSVLSQFARGVRVLVSSAPGRVKGKAPALLAALDSCSLLLESRHHAVHHPGPER